MLGRGRQCEHTQFLWRAEQGRRQDQVELLIIQEAFKSDCRRIEQIVRTRQLHHRNGPTQIGHRKRNRLQLVLAHVAAEHHRARINRGGDIGGDGEQRRLAQLLPVQYRRGFNHSVAEAFQQMPRGLQTLGCFGAQFGAIRRGTPKCDLQRHRVSRHGLQEGALRSWCHIAAAGLAAM